MPEEPRAFDLIVIGGGPAGIVWGYHGRGILKESCGS
jgi:cation diffusion facilitator CzcD-associated flavoprotein CzcO